MKVIKKSHTGINIKNILTECFQENGIILAQVVSFTIDNGKNLVAMGNLFNEDDDDETTFAPSSCDERQSHLQAENLENEGDFHDDLDDQEIFNMIETHADGCDLDEEELDDVLDPYEEVLSHVVGEFEIKSGNVFVIRCASHTLQLAVHDALKASNTIATISLCRTVAKALRIRTRINELTERGLKSKLPRLDCITRWNSTFIMVNILQMIFFF